MGAYAEILRHTPDHEDLLTTTDNEVFYRLVGRWVGQGGKGGGGVQMETEDDTSGVFVLQQGAGLFETKQGEERRNLCWKHDYNMDQTNGGRGCLKDTVKEWTKTTLSLNNVGDPLHQISGMR